VANYWLDSTVFIEAKNGAYGFDIVPGFWEWIEQQSAAKVLSSSTLVHDELVEGNDQLARWTKERKDSGLFVVPNETVQKVMTDIADFVSASYDGANATLFLEGADAWTIAHAAIDGAVVVTHEKLVGPNCRKAKIPNVAKQFGVKCVTPYEMLRALKASFVLRQ
jgi:hypothetical protein